MDALAQQIARMLRPIQARISTLISRAVLRAINDAGGLQLVQVGIRAGELRDGVEHFQPYGFTFHPLEGAQAAVAYVGGCGNHPVALVVVDPRHRLANLEPGEVALYDHLGKFIRLNADGTLHIKAPKIVIDTEDLRLYASSTYRWDVHGYAQEVRWVGGTTWQNATWQAGATLAAPAVNPISPPQVAL
jgi:phage baseplate assembly protein V